MGCCFAIFALLIGLAIGAVLLRAACYLAKEDVPEFGKAMGVVFVVAMIQLLVNIVFNLAMGQPIVQDETQPVTNDQIIASIVVFLVQIPVAMWIYRVMIPTSSFATAALVWLIQFLIILAITLVFGVVVFAFAMAGVL